MRCKSHFIIFKTEKCMKDAYKFMKITSICYFCARKLKQMYGLTESDLLENDFYKKFLKSGSLSPKYFPLSIGISE